LEAFPADVVNFQTSSSLSVLHFSPLAAAMNLAIMDASILHSSPVIVAVNVLIVPLSNTHQVISLKLTKINYL
jgi:hypothetical protein